jgi:hypothetical protein
VLVGLCLRGELHCLLALGVGLWDLLDACEFLEGEEKKDKRMAIKLTFFLVKSSIKYRFQHGLRY